MNRIKKAALCVIAAVTLSFTAVSCGNVFVNSADSARTNESSNAGNENSSSEFYEKVADKIDISVSVIGASDEQSDLVTTLERIRPSVVEIYSTTSKGVSSGSGVVINLSDTDDNGVTDTGFIVTCHHVIDGATSTTVKSIEGVEYSARLIGSDPKSDIAVICINSSINKPLTELSAASWYEDSDKLKVGMDVVAIGNPLGILGGTVSKGIISSINRDVLVDGKSMSLLQTDAAINGGNSGGGLFDVNTGALIGIVNAGYASYTAEGLNFAIPSNVAFDIETQLLKTYGETKGYIAGNYDFGVEFGLAYSGFGFSSKYYVTISEIDVYGTFYKGGLRSGDLIYSIQIGDEIFSLSSISSNTITKLDAFLAKAGYKIGDKVTVSYGRYEVNSYVTHNAEFEIAQYIYG